MDRRAFAVVFLLGIFVVTVLKLFVLVKNSPPQNDDGELDITHKIVYRHSNKFKVESLVDFELTGRFVPTDVSYPDDSYPKLR